MLSTHFTGSFFDAYEHRLGKNVVKALLLIMEFPDRPAQITVAQAIEFMHATNDLHMSWQHVLAFNRAVGKTFGQSFEGYINSIEDVPALLRPLTDAVVFDEDVIIEACPFCMPFRPQNLIKKRCICSFVEGWLTIAFKNQYTIHEIECLAKGDRACIFRVSSTVPSSYQRFAIRPI